MNMNEVDLDRLRHKWRRIQQLSMLTEVLRTLITSLKLEESEIMSGTEEQHAAAPVASHDWERPPLSPTHSSLASL
jgi:hypothetical protein